jgi:hypothetical protein
VFWLSDRFRTESFGKKILFKAAIYIATLVGAVLVTGLLVNSYRLGEPPWSPAALHSGPGQLLGHLSPTK